MSSLHRDQEYHMNMTRKAWLVPVLSAAAVCWGSTLAAQDKDEQEGNQAAVAKAVLGARVPLERGLAASASHGQAISAKFFEVVVDHNTGKVAKAEPIAAGEDYTAAQSQKAAMAKAKGSLRAAVRKAVRDNAGYRAVSITPSLKDGRPVADVTLAKGDELKTVSVPL